MPDHGEFQGNAESSSPNASPDNLEEAMWRLKVEDGNRDGSDANHNLYPDRPGAPDCIFYLKTGLCGYGSNCRYNHPNHNGQVTQDGGELPERVGQPDCQYFLKTGTCKFGASCKYHHPRDRNDVQPAPLNVLGLPMRQDEKSCPYYMRTGSCKFGVACKFNHPQPAGYEGLYPATGPSAYGSTGSSVASPSSLPLVGAISTWPLARPYLSSPRMPGLPTYMPVMVPSSPGTMMTPQGWSTYTGSMGQLAPTDVVGQAPIPNTKFHSQSSSVNLPERPDQPECQYYMKNGSCKYGPSCKYHHPKDRYSEGPITIGPLGLPLRPGHDVCSFYSMYGSCRYGVACKFDHPIMGFYNYAVPALSVPDPSAVYPPNQRSSPPQVTAGAKPVKSADRLKKSGKTNNTEQKADACNNNEHTSNALATDAAPATAPPSEPSANHSD